MRTRALCFVLFVLVLFSVPGLAGYAPPATGPVTIRAPAVTASWLRAC